MATDEEDEEYDTESLELLISGYVREFQEKIDLFSDVPPGIIKLMNSYYLVQAVVIVSGSEKMMAGYSGHDAPSCTFPSVVGRPRNKNDTLKEKVYGDEAIQKKDTFLLKYPIECGYITNWGNMEFLLQNTFSNELQIGIKGGDVLHSECPHNSKQNREKLTQIMFENFEVARFYVAIDAVLSLYASGRSTGCVVSMGASVCHSVPVVDGCVSSHAIRRSDLAGRDITNHLNRLLTERGYGFVEREYIKDMKEKQCYVALNYDAEMKKSESDLEKDYELPDGQVLTFAKERFQCSEMLFQPRLLGSKMDGLHQVVYSSIQRVDFHSRKDLLPNIVLSGGTSLFPGLQERMQKELVRLFGQDYRVKVIAPPERKYSEWIGGSILSSMALFEAMWMTKVEYEEHGPSYIHRKCD